MFDTLYQIRYAECDLFGHLNHTGYFDYLQEGLLQAGEASGYGMERLRDEGYLPTITAASLEYLRPLFFRQRIRLLPSLIECGRYSCRLGIAFVPEGEDKPAARGEAELLLARAGEPQPLPEVLHDRLCTLPAAADRVGLCLPDDTGRLPEEYSFRTERRVTSADTNPSGLMNMTAGISFFEDCGLSQCNSVGWPFTRMAEENIGIVARKYTVRYLKPLPMDSHVTVRTWLHSPRGVGIERHYSMVREGETTPGTLAHCLWIFFDPARQRPMRMPEPFIRDFGHLIVPARTTT